jgi:hypothetical protein
LPPTTGLRAVNYSTILQKLLTRYTNGGRTWQQNTLLFWYAHILDVRTVGGTVIAAALYALSSPSLKREVGGKYERSMGESLDAALE